MDSQSTGVAFPSLYQIVPVWSEQPQDDVYAAFRAAKATLPTDTLIKLQRAVPGSPGRILAIGSPPPWACEWLGVRDLHDIDKLAHVLQWAMSDIEDDRAQGELEFLQSIFGKEVREIV